MLTKRCNSISPSNNIFRNVSRLYTRVKCLKLVTSAIQGFHVYKAIWENPVTGKELNYRRKVETHVTLSVAVIKLIDGEDTNVRHIP